MNKLVKVGAGAGTDRSARGLAWITEIFIYVLLTNKYMCESYNTRCDLAWSRNWSVYVTTSKLALSLDDVMSAEFSDEGIIYEEAFPCDPSLFFYNSTLTNVTMLENGESFNWETVPADITMLNVSCTHPRKHTIGAIMPKNYQGLQSFGVRCNIGNPDADFLYGLRHLMILDLSRNNITTLSRNVFEHVIHLLILTLNDNPIVQYDSNVLCDFYRLFSLNLQNTFSQYPLDLFSNVSAPVCSRFGYTQLLRLSKSKFYSVPNFAFTNFNDLSNEVQLAGCRINSIEENAFVGLEFLKYLFLSDNNISSISAVMEPLVNLNELVLNNNSLQELSVIHLRKNWKLRILDLRHNQIQNVSGFDGYILPNLIYLDLSYNRINEYWAEGFNAFPALKQIYLQFNNISDINSNFFGDLKFLEIVNLSSNTISDLSPHAFSNLTMLKNLDLSENEIGYLNDNLLDNNPLLEILRLNGNRLKLIFAESLISSRAAVISSISLHDNPWQCDCQLDPLRKWMLNFSHKVEHPDMVVCASPSEMAGTPLKSSSNFCSVPISGGIIAISVLLVLVVVVLVSLIAVYYFRGEIAVIIFAKYGFRFKSNISKNESERKYDAFVSHSSDDVQFVIKSLMPKLEIEHRFKLCVHFRDFRVGEPIADNITQAIDNSRRTILLVSRNFIHSEWCKYEFQMAHHQLLSEGGRKVILVLMEDIQQSEMERQLRSYIKTHTYLRMDDKLFWEKLLYALPDQKSQSESVEGQQSPT